MYFTERSEKPDNAQPHIVKPFFSIFANLSPWFSIIGIKPNHHYDYTTT